MSELLERDGDLGVLREAVSVAAGGGGSLVLVTGDAGIGKSSLVNSFAADPGADARILTGWCDDLLTSRTYGPFRDVARRVGGALADAIAATDTAAVMESVLDLLSDPLRATVLILEDVHWADEATLDVVRFVGRRLVGRPGVLVLTYRENDLTPDHPLRGVIGAFQSSLVRRIHLRPLTRVAIEQLLRGSGHDADEVLALTGGNPFYVTELAVGGQLPESVTDAVVARLASMSPEAQEVAELFSVLPRAIGRDDVIDLDIDTDALADAEARGLLVAKDGRIGFRHELARRAVLASLPVTQRVLHHARVLDLLLEREAEPAAILHHAVGAGRADVVARHGPRAVHAAHEASAHRQAVSHAEQVLRYDQLLDDVGLAVVLEEYGWSLYNLGRFDEARAAAERAVTLRAAGTDRTAHARAVLMAARMAYMSADPARCFELIEVAATLCDDCDPEIQAEVRVNRAAMLHLADCHDEAIAEADRAEPLVDADERPDLAALIGMYRGGSRVGIGDLDGLDELRSVVSAERSKRTIEPIARAFTNLIEWLVGFRRWEDAAQTIDRALAYYDDHDFRAHRFNTEAQLAWMHLLRGKWTSADEILRGLAPPHGTEGEFGVLEAIPRGARALLAVRSGADDAEQQLAKAWEVSLRSNSAWYVVPTACAGIEWAWGRGEPDRAEPYITAGFELAADTAWRDWLWWRLAALLGRDVDPAPMTIAAERSGVEGGWAAGAASWEQLQMPYERALELIRSGQVDPTLEGLSILDDLGAEPAARIARQRLRDLGVRSIPRGPQARTRENPMGLTDRQLEVLDLLAEGLTNAEIADRLVVSVRTVDHHVSAVLQKLGVDNRQEAAGFATEITT